LHLDHLWLSVLKQKLSAACCFWEQDWDTQEHMQTFKQNLLDGEVGEMYDIPFSVRRHIMTHNFKEWRDFAYFASDLTSLNTDKRTSATEVFWRIFSTTTHCYSDHTKIPIHSILEFKNMLCMAFLKM
jgi:hypothetical protein